MTDPTPTAFNRALDNIGKWKGPGGFHDWSGKLRQAFSLYARPMLLVIDGTPCPTDPQEEREGWEKANTNLFSILFFMTEGSAFVTVKEHEGTTAGVAGDGAAAWNALKERFDGNTKEARRACRDKLFNNPMKPGSDPVDHFAAMDDMRLRLKGYGEAIIDDSYADVLLRSLPKEYDFIIQINHRDRSFSLEDIKRTAINFYIDELSRKSSQPSIAGRGAAMAVASGGDQCHNCLGYGHFRKDCPKPVQKKRPTKWKKKRGPKPGGGGSSQKWCSYHKTASHSDSDCYKQKELKKAELNQLAANLALLNIKPQAGQFSNIGSALVAQNPPPEPESEPITFGFSYCAIGSSSAGATAAASTTASPSAASAGKPAASTSQQTSAPGGIFGAFMAASTALSAGIFWSGGDTVTMLVDSGATENFIDPLLTPGLEDSMRDFRALNVPHLVEGIGGKILNGVATGTVHGTVVDDSGLKQPFSFHAIVVPGLGSNLFSVCTAWEQGIASIFHPKKPRLEYSDSAFGDVALPMNVVGVDKKTGKLLCTFALQLGDGSGGGSSALALRAASAELWHRRMGHINRRSLDVLRKLPGNGVEYDGDMDACGVCAVGKSEQQAHPKQATHDAQHPFQSITVDLMGPISPTAIGGYRTVAKYVDQVTKWKEIFLLKDKTQTTDSLKLFNTGLVAPSGYRVERAKADRGTEFTSAEFRQYCREVGIKLVFASTNTPQQIGDNERAGKTILGIVRCLLADSGLPNTLWGELMRAAVYISNRTPHAALKNETPYKRLYGKDANLGHFRTIGARAFVHVETRGRKLDQRAWEGRLVGYSLDSLSYRVYNPATGTVRESRNVIFIETPTAMPEPDLANGLEEGEFTYDDVDDMVRDIRNYSSNIDLSLSPAAGQTVNPSVRELLNQIKETTERDATPTDHQSGDPPGGDNPGGDSPGDSPGGESPTPSEGGSPAGSGGGTESGGSSGDSGSGSTSQGGGSSRGGTASRGGRGARGGRGGTTSRGGRGGSTPQRPATRSMTQGPNARTLRELKRLGLHTKGERQDIAHKDEFVYFVHYALAAQNVQQKVPRTFPEAMELADAKEWLAATRKEMDRLEELEVFTLVPRKTVPAGNRIYKAQWVFKIKADNSYKARLVVSGWGQVPGRDCGNTYAPVCRLQSVRMVLAIAAEMDWEVVQLDVNTAFLYAIMEEQVHVEAAPGYEKMDEDGVPLVMELHKSLYGLAQSPGNWFKTIDPELIALGFVPLKSDTCVYIYRKNGVVIILTLYVDDLLLVGADIQVIESIKRKLMERFKMTDMGDVSLVLGMQVTRDRQQKTITISQENYTRSILEKFGMANCKPVSTPGFGQELSTNQPEENLLDEEEKQRYQAITGSVMYLAQVLRYDVMYSTCQLARAMSKPSKVHMGAAKHLLRYLAGTLDFSLVYKRGGFKLTAFSDSNWGNNPDNGKSTSCYIMMFCKAPVSFRSGIQSLTAMSTMEAELVAAALTMKEAIFCSNMLIELGFGNEVEKVPLYIDNTATLHVIGNRAYSSRTKHIALRFFYIRELVSEGKMSIHYVCTEDNLADIGTKHLSKHRLQQLLHKFKNF